MSQTESIPNEEVDADALARQQEAQREAMLRAVASRETSTVTGDAEVIVIRHNCIPTADHIAHRQYMRVNTRFASTSADL